MNEKLQKHRIIVAAYQLFLQMIGLLFDMFTAAVFIFFLEIPKCVQALNNNISLLTTWRTWVGILWKWASMVNKLAGDSECRLALFHMIRNFSFIVFQDCRTIVEQPALYNQLFIQPL